MGLNVENYMKKNSTCLEFTCVNEFLKSYKIHSDNLSEDSNEGIIAKFGIWLKIKDQMVNICAIDDKGVFLLDRFLDWKDLVKYCYFLDGTPCQKQI